MTASSHTKKGSFLMEGSSWWYQRWRQDLPERPGIPLATLFHVPGHPFGCRGDYGSVRHFPLGGTRLVFYHSSLERGDMGPEGNNELDTCIGEARICRCRRRVSEAH